MPALSNRMLLRSGITGGTEFYIYYTELGWPYTLGVVNDDLVTELYRFRYSSYSASGKLNKFITIIDPDGIKQNPDGTSINNPPTIQTSDTLLFDTSGILTSISRRYPLTGDPNDAFTISYGAGGSSLNMNDIYFGS
ncbi:MAG: hypothetical protein L0Y35_09730, partial [Flammeovirgaceae bacterium]|nr:hypothetical protein [Flammeovirgaceae bacterium]